MLKFTKLSTLLIFTGCGLFVMDDSLAAVYCPTSITYHCVPSLTKKDPSDIKSFCTLTSTAPQGWTFYPPAKNAQSPQYSSRFQSANSLNPMPSDLPPGSYTQPAANAVYDEPSEAGMCWYISIVNGTTVAYSALFKQPTTTAPSHWTKSTNGYYCPITDSTFCAFSASS
ncbi:MAG: hypothetical protein A3F13_06100 [Gammaproteobacteria bacterium RIFCSPHIGHO2_12_FULL_40_19]|nr:MAG: hypothetical protein A3F13_06100 [Gammaproteobacteria bacterium RIFCSPHIGHO2_12_FULL_40_19]